MGIRGVIRNLRNLARRIAHVLSRPVRTDRGEGGVVIQPYRGFGSPHEIFMMGRVLRQSGMGTQLRTTSARRDFLDVIRRVLRRGVHNAVLSARLTHTEPLPNSLQRFEADGDGYFRIRLQSPQPLSNDQQWHPVELQLIEPAEFANGEGASIQGQVYVPPPTATRVIISDIDDTVMFTGVLNKAKMMWRLFFQGPKSRVAFAGVASLYRAFHQGPTGNEFNPMLYVSRAPWGIYEVLQEFFRIHRIPVGPILFLREWGIRWHSPLPRRAEDHKQNLIREMLDLYRDYPFVLIGDSGQHDPEIYAQLVQEYPGRVEAVYIRNVNRGNSRILAIEELAKQVLANGSTLMLAADSFSMAKHAAEHGLISPQALRDVLSEQSDDLKASEQPVVPPIKTEEITRPTVQQTQQAVEHGAIQDALDADTGTELPPSVSIESHQAKR